MSPMIKSWLRRLLPDPILERLYDWRYAGLPQPFRVVRPHTMLSNLNLFFLQELARRVERLGVPGDFVECGVYKGGSAGVLAYEAIQSRFPRKVWLYDSFEAMPAATGQDDAKARAIQGQFPGSDAQARRILERLAVPADRYAIVKGWFDQTLPQAPSRPVAILHIDCNYYAPVRLTWETFYSAVQPGGFVVINDYGCYAGCRQASDEFLARQAPLPQVIPIDHEAYYLQKPSPPADPGPTG